MFSGGDNVRTMGLAEWIIDVLFSFSFFPAMFACFPQLQPSFELNIELR